MLAWGSIILQVLRIANYLMDMAMQNKWMKVGEDRAVAEAARDLFRKTEYAKVIHANVDKLDDKNVDDLLARFEPK